MPDAAGSYAIQRELKPQTTWLATDASGRQLVLKRLPPDCLRQGRLHPQVHDRLSRFRELPLMTFATLIGVERVGDDIVTVSEYVDGMPLSEVPIEQRPRAIAGLRDAILSLHSLGLVHGQLHDGNVRVDATGAVRVLDPSPLLHDDPAADLAALARFAPSRDDEPVAAPADEDEPIRRRTLIAAAVVAGFGIIAAIAAAIIGSRL